MPHCDNCGEQVSSDYARVFAINDIVECCPFCDDMSRDKNGRAYRIESIKTEGPSTWPAMADGGRVE